MKPLIPVSVLTGFLGSGKTTVLNHLVHQPALNRTLVIINEFGAIGLDHLLVSHSQDDVVVEMSSGCLCCTIRGDLVRTLRDAPGRFAREGRCWFDRVVIETTGLADPAPILHTLMSDPVLLNRYRLDGVITTVDGVNGLQTLERQFESVKQVAVADRLLLTKTDLADGATLAALETRLHQLNPAAPLLRAVNGQVAAQELLEAGLFDPGSKIPDVGRWLREEAYARHDHEHHDHDHDHHDHEHHDHGHHHHDINRHDEQIRAFCITYDRPLRVTAFELWLQIIMAMCGPDLLRIKGLVNLVGSPGPLVIHGVQHVFHPPRQLDHWPDGDRRTRLVFITRNVQEAVLRETLVQFNEIED